MDTKQKVIEKLKKWIKDTNIFEYDEEIGLDCDDKELETLRDGKTKKEVYVVSFKTQDYVEYDTKGEIISLMEGMYCFAYFDAQTLELLYIHKKAGYIEPDGSF
jgi:hypothetical protein